MFTKSASMNEEPLTSCCPGGAADQQPSEKCAKAKRFSLRTARSESTEVSIRTHIEISFGIESRDRAAFQPLSRVCDAYASARVYYLSESTSKAPPSRLHGVCFAFVVVGCFPPLILGARS
jgi:hypothetical protein